MEIAKRVYTQKEVNKIFGHIPSKTLRWWGMRDLYGWANHTIDGRGIHREYELAHIYQIGIVEELSSLNIPVGVINRIIRKHFLSGVLMHPLRADLHEDAFEGGPRVNVGDQMNKTLILTKTLSSYNRLIIKRHPKYESFLTDNDSNIVLGPRDIVLDSVKIIINLEKIKNYVHKLIRDFTG